MALKTFLKTYKHQIFIWIGIAIVIAVALKFGIDKKAVVFGTVVVGVFTQAFAGFAALVAAVPLIGPFIVKVFAIPFFWLLNALGYFVCAIAIKTGYSS